MWTKSAYLDKTIILEGCNGEWAQERYLPLLADRAAKGDIELWAISLDDKILLKNDKTQEFWTTAQAHDKAHYLNKKKNEQSYNRLSDATHVFVVTPDRTHSQIAKSWLERLAPNGKIFIEKPLDASMRSADELREDIKKKKKEDTVFVFDHYLARAYPLLQDKNGGLAQIGTIEKIEFHILESAPIKENRSKTLDRGIIFDLFSYVLTLSGALIERKLTPLISILQRAEIREVKAAQYLGSPIAGETFSQVKFTFDNVEVTSLLGKGIGTQDDKEMIVYGSNGIIKLDFLMNTCFIFNHEGEEKLQGKLEAMHVETFLEELIDKDKQPISIPGVLDFDTGFEILAILDKAKTQVEKMLPYQVGEPIDNILKRL